MALASCGTPSPPRPDTAAPPRLAADLCAAPAAKPALPAAAGIPRPVNDAGRAALAAFLNWTSDLNAWGDGLAARAARTAASAPCKG
jgi:hypothetical protein